MFSPVIWILSPQFWKKKFVYFSVSFLSHFTALFHSQQSKYFQLDILLKILKTSKKHGGAQLYLLFLVQIELFMYKNTVKKSNLDESQINY